MERHTFKSFVCTAGLLIACSAVGGEKIQFSAPAKEAEIPTEERNLSKPAPNLFDKFRNGGADALNVPMPMMPQERSTQRPSEEKRDWILADPDNKKDATQEMFQMNRDQSETRSRGLEYYVDALEQRQGQEQEQRQNSRVIERDGEFGSSTRNRTYSFQSDAQKLSSAGKEDFDARNFERDSFSFQDYWRETTGLNTDRFEEQSALRRAEFQQIFEKPAAALPQVVTANGSDPANLIAPPPTDFRSSTSQSSLAEANQGGSLPMNGSRSDLFGNVNQRALGRDSSGPLNTRVEHPKIQAQPAVLPFPSRPGELFKRPGSF